MLNHWTRSALSAGTFAGIFAGLSACSSEEPNQNVPGSSSGGETAVATGGMGAGSQASGGNGPGPTAGGSDDPGFELGSGGSSEPDVYDGGLRPLTPEQVAKIQEGECAADSEEVTALPPVLQFVVDVSGSMRNPAPGNEDMSKWEVTAAALLDALDALPDDMPVGLQLYPSEDATCGGGFGGGNGPGGGLGPGDGDAAGDDDAAGDGDGPGGFGDDPPVDDMTGDGDFPAPQEQQAGTGTCVAQDALTPIDVLGTPGSAQRTALSDAIDAVQLYNGTPTHDAYVFALEQSLRLDASGRRQFMLLITDGAPTQTQGCSEMICEDLAPDGPETAAIIQEIAAAQADGVGTYVIGSPGSEVGGWDGNGGPDMRPWLSEAAEMGGTAPEGCAHTDGNYCHFDMTQAADFGQALAEGLSEIAGELEASCDFEIPERNDVDVRATEVVLNWGDGTAVKAVLDEMGECTDGWRLTGERTMELCPTTCAAFQADNGASVTVSFNCEIEVR